MTRPRPADDGGGSPERAPADRPVRTDPAAMRAELDAARRNLGAAPPVEPFRSAARQRALLREAAAARSTAAGVPGRPPGARE